MIRERHDKSVGHRGQLFHLNEFGAENQWLVKLKNASDYEDWVAVTIDSIWMKRLSQIAQFGKAPKPGFKLWILCPPYFANGLSRLSESIPKYQLIVDSDPLETRSRFAVIWEGMMNEAIDVPSHPWSFIVVRYHLFILTFFNPQSYLRLHAVNQIDMTHLQMAFNVLDNIVSKDNHTLALVEQELNRIVYQQRVTNHVSVEAMRHFWNLACRDFDESIDNAFNEEEEDEDGFPPNSIPQFISKAMVRILSSERPSILELCSEKTRPTPMYAVAELSARILQVIKPKAKAKENEKDHDNGAHNWNIYLQRLPKSINLRNLSEIGILAQSKTLTKILWIEEAIGYCVLLKFLRDDLACFVAKESSRCSWGVVRDWIIQFGHVDSSKLYKRLVLSMPASYWKSTFSKMVSYFSSLLQNIQWSESSRIHVQNLLSPCTLVDMARLEYFEQNKMPVDDTAAVGVFYRNTSENSLNAKFCLQGLSIQHTSANSIAADQTESNEETWLPELSLRFVPVDDFSTRNKPLTIILADRVEGMVGYEDNIGFNYLDSRVQSNVTSLAYVAPTQESDSVNQAATTANDSLVGVDCAEGVRPDVNLFLIANDDMNNEMDILLTTLGAINKDISRNNQEIVLIDHQNYVKTLSSSLSDVLITSLYHVETCQIFVLLLGERLGERVSKSTISPDVFQRFPKLEIVLNAVCNDCGQFYLPELLVTYHFKTRGASAERFAYCRSTKFSETLPKSLQSLYQAREVEEKESVLRIRDLVVLRGGASAYMDYSCSYSHYDGIGIRFHPIAHFEERMSDDLKMTIQSVFNQRIRESVMIPIPTTENALETLHVRAFNDLKERIRGNNTLLVLGESGSGRSALLARTLLELENQGMVILSNFTGTWIGSLDTNKVLTRFCRKLYCVLGQRAVIPNLFESLVQLFWNLLEQVINLNASGVVVLIDDAESLHLGKFSDSFKWVPSAMDVNVRVFSNTHWVFASQKNTGVEQTLCERRNQVETFSVPELESTERKKLIDRWITLRHLDCPDKTLAAWMHATTPLHIGAIARNIRLRMLLREPIFPLPNTVEALHASNLNYLEALYGTEKIKKLFCLLNLSHGGLFTFELCDLLEMTPYDLTKFQSELGDFVCMSDYGTLVFYHESFTMSVSERYLCDAEVEKKYHRTLWEYFKKSIKFSNKSSQSPIHTIAIRMMNIEEHQMKQNASIKEIVDTICSIQFVSMLPPGSFYTLRDRYIALLRRITSQTVQIDYKIRILDYLRFIQTYIEVLDESPPMALTFAYNLPENSCPIVRNEALRIVKSSEGIRGGFIEHLTTNSSKQAGHLAVVGKHTSTIVSAKVIVHKVYGKAVVTVSDDGEVIVWNVDTFPSNTVLLAAFLPPKNVIDVAFSPNGAVYLALVTAAGDILIYDSSVRNKVTFLTTIKSGARVKGLCFFSHGEIYFEESGRILHAQISGQASLSSSKPQMQHSFSEYSHIAAVSDDGQKLALINSKKPDELAIFSILKEKVVCKFTWNLLTSDSMAKFSYTKDLVAAVGKDNTVIVWKVDNHSRVAVRKLDSWIKSICFSSDDKYLISTLGNDVIEFLDLRTGLVFKRMDANGATVLHSMHVHDQECILAGENSEFKFAGVLEKTEKEEVDTVSLQRSPIIKLALMKSNKDANRLSFFCSQRGSFGFVRACSNSRVLKLDNLATDIDPITWSFVTAEESVALLLGHSSIDLWDLDASVRVKVIQLDVDYKVVKAFIRKHDNNWNMFIQSDEDTLYAIDMCDALKNPSMSSLSSLPVVWERDALVVPDDPFAYSNSSIVVGNQYGAHVIEAHTGNVLKTYKIMFGHVIETLSIGTHRRSILVGTQDTIYLNGEITSHPGNVGDTTRITGSGFDSSGKYLYYTAKDEGKGRVVVFTAKDRKRYCALEHDRPISFEGFTFDGKYMVTVTDNSIIRVWRIDKVPILCLQYSLYTQPSCVEISNTEYAVLVGNEVGIISMYRLHLSMSQD